MKWDSPRHRHKKVYWLFLDMAQPHRRSVVLPRVSLTIGLPLSESEAHVDLR